MVHISPSYTHLLIACKRESTARKSLPKNISIVSAVKQFCLIVFSGKSSKPETTITVRQLK